MKISKETPLYKMPQQMPAKGDSSDKFKDTPLARSMKDYGLAELNEIVKKAPQSNWVDKIIESYPELESKDRARIKKILNEGITYYRDTERLIIQKRWLLREWKTVLSIKSLKTVLFAIRDYGEIFCGRDEILQGKIVEVLSSMLSIVNSRQSFESKVMRASKSIWGTTNRKKCSFLSSAFVKITVRKLCELWSEKNQYYTKEDARGLTATTKRSQFVGDVLEAYFGISLSNQAVRKVIDRLRIPITIIQEDSEK